jgi:tellurite resistance protein
MNIPVLDRSHYLKGLLITAKLDKQLTDKEKDMIKGISDKLGFATDFFNETIRGLLSNQYISDEPIKFSDKKIAESFLSDAIKLAYSDGHISDAELNWLKETAKINSFSENFVQNKIRIYKESPLLLRNTEFALYSII